jgi:hypothetical protein
MLIKFFRNGQGSGSGPVDYMVASHVAAYDENRNMRRDNNRQVIMLERKPLPDVLRGEPDRTRQLIDCCPFEWRYRAGVLSFTREDNPSAEQQEAVMNAFEELAFAGLDPHDRDILWVRHSHEGRAELHFVTPRQELRYGRSLNIAPPGYKRPYDALRDVLNKQFNWNDPQAPERAREVKSLLESVRRGDAREQLHDWVVERVNEGVISNREEMLTQLTAAGFDIPRAGKDYITVRDPETNERWRLKGAMFHEDWKREATFERSGALSAGTGSHAGSRLDGLALEELRARLQQFVKDRRSYNLKRFGRPSARHQRGQNADLGGSDNQPRHLRQDQPDWADVRGDWRGAAPVVLRADELGAGNEACEVGPSGRVQEIGLSADQERDGNHLHLGSQPPGAEQLYSGREIPAMPDRETETIEEEYDGRAEDALGAHPDGARVVALLRAIGNRIRELWQILRRAGAELAERDVASDGQARDIHAVIVANAEGAQRILAEVWERVRVALKPAETPSSVAKPSRASETPKTSIATGITVNM